MIDFKVTAVQGQHLKDVTFEVGMARKSVTIEGCPGEFVVGQHFQLTEVVEESAEGAEEAEDSGKKRKGGKSV